MRIPTECVSLKNCWTLSSSYDFQACTSIVPKADVIFPDSSTVFGGAPKPVAVAQRLVLGAPRLVASAPRCTQVCCRRSHVLPCAPKVLSSASTCSQTYDNHSDGTHGPMVRDHRHCEGWLECPPRVRYSPEIDLCKFILHLLSDTPGGSRWPVYILLMYHHSAHQRNTRAIQMFVERW